MARTITEIYNEIKAEAVRQATDQGNTEMLDLLNNLSGFSAWRILFYIMAFCSWTLENLWDKFQALINSIIATLTPHHTRWYRTKALAFQYGFNLLPESDKYDNTGYTAAQIEASKLVKYAAVNEATIDGKRVLLVKIAGVDSGGNLVQLPTIVEDAFKAYMEDIRDAGVFIIIYNRQADTLRAVVDVYYNPLLLDATGNSLSGLPAGKPLEDAAKRYLLKLPFNGEFSNAAFVDTLQTAYGVSDKNVFLVTMLRKISPTNFQAVPNTFIPDAGYVAFDVVNGLVINYISHV